MSATGTPTGREFRLRIVASSTEKPGSEVRVDAGAGTIGRDPGCTLVLNEPSVSRKHAQIEQTPQGFKLTDLGSGNGVWVGKEKVKEALLAPGKKFRIGSTVLECLLVGRPADVDFSATVLVTDPERVPKDAEPLSPAESAFVVRVHVQGQEEKVKEIKADTGPVIAGRDKGCTIVLEDKDVSRKHVKIELTSNELFVTDLESSYGVWVNGKRIEQPFVLGTGQRIQIGKRTFLECQLPTEASNAAPATPVRPSPAAQPAPVSTPPAPPPPALPAEPEEDEFSETVMMPAPAELLKETRRIEDEGEPVELGANQPFLIEDPETVWYVVSGGVEIFTVSVQEGKPVGSRSHFLGIRPGQCFLGFDLASYGMGSGFLAVGKPGTKLRKLSLSRLRELAATPSSVKAVTGLLDTWVGGLNKSLIRDIRRREADVLLTPGKEVSLGLQKRATAEQDVVWVETWSGSLLFDNMATPTFTGRRTLFPVTRDSWIQPVGDEFGDLALKPLSTERAAGGPLLWEGLQIFHQVLFECEFLNKKLATVDEFVRLQDKAQHVEAAQEAAYDAIGSVLRTEAATPKEFLATGSAEPVLRACKLVGAELGMKVKAHPEATESLTYEEKVNAISSASGFRTRVVALRGGWWTEDSGPLLGLIEETQTPVTLLPTSANSYEWISGKTGERAPVTEELAAKLSAFAYTFYRPFPDGPMGVIDLVRFGSFGLQGDFKLLILMGIVVGLFGTLTPYITGRIYDAAIPQADRNMLWGFGLALLVAALSTSLFKLVQGAATVRVQGKMEYSIQAALWDRLLDLPATFFRKYSAGDLADRVAGIDAIQTLVAGAGIAAILGSFSGLFYVFQMFTYNTTLALLAIGLTLFFVSVSTVANYLQLRHQRVEIKMRGRITGLVLNLITGVTKLRISGAEPHAFRVWAQRFAEQRKVSFAIGRIQNFVQVFNSLFPVISSITIFMIMIGEQAAAAESGEPGLTTGDFIAFSAAYGLFLASMQALADASLNMLRVVPIYERLKPILTTPAEVDASKVYPGKLKGEIEISHAHFRYIEDGPWIIKDLSLKVKPGEFVAFVGGSGCGKSTLMRLLLGFETTSSGAIYYDGQDISSLDLRLLRRQMGVVLQASRVMPADIYRNIVGVSSRTLDEAWEAAAAAGMAQDIKAMPMGMHTYVSEGGGTLSGGQRQRLLICRAIVNKPKVLFLDEATSALDNRAQAMVTESMDRMEATRIVIAHRLSTVINADRICYLEGGRIAEMGTYQELMEKDGLFAQLARRQQV